VSFIVLEKVLEGALNHMLSSDQYDGPWRSLIMTVTMFGLGTFGCGWIGQLEGYCVPVSFQTLFLFRERFSVLDIVNSFSSFSHRTIQVLNLLFLFFLGGFEI